MIGALVYLQFRSVLNRQVMRLKRLRKPKYLVGGIVGALYFYFYFFRFLFMGGGRHTGSRFGRPAIDLQSMEGIGAAILLVIVLLAWIFPHSRAALMFTEAEVNFLFPAPVTRRTLIQFKLLKSQTAILFTTLLLTLITGRFGGAGAGWIRALGWWVILSTLNLHFLASSFARTMLLERGITTWKRRLGIFVLIAGFLTVVVIWSKQTIPNLQLADLVDFNTAKQYFEQAMTAGPIPYLLYPFRLIVRPFFASDAGQFARTVGPALLIMLAHYLWVVRANVAFEEASVELSRRIAERVSAIRSGRGQPRPTRAKRAPFTLAPTGPPAIALLWKNLIGAGQLFSGRMGLILLFSLVPMLIVFSTSLGHSPISAIIGFGALIVAFWSLLIGPQVLRHDFRNDLQVADILKALPMRGWQVVLGELLAPAVILTAIQWLAILVAAIFVSDGPQGAPFPLYWRLAVALSAAMVLPMLDLISLIIPNASVLLYPAWFQTGKDGPQGIEATGQRLIFLLGQVLVFAIALLPAAVVFAVVYFPLSYLGQRLLAVPVASLGSALMLAIEASVAVALLGRVFERFDLSAET